MFLRINFGGQIFKQLPHLRSFWLNVTGVVRFFVGILLLCGSGGNERPLMDNLI